MVNELDMKKINKITNELNNFFIERKCNRAEVELILVFFKSVLTKQEMLRMMTDMGIITESTLEEGFKNLRELRGG